MKNRNAGIGLLEASTATLYQTGRLAVAEGLQVPPVAQLVDAIRDRWGKPVVTVCDRFRLGDMQDAARGWRIEPRVTRWSDAAADIRALRKMVKDGPLTVERESAGLIEASLSVALVQNDDAGNVRDLVKRDGSPTTRRGMTWRRR